MTIRSAILAACGGSGTQTDPYFPYTTLLLHGDGTNGAANKTFLDSSSNNFTITPNGNVTQGSFSPYGVNWSTQFDGSTAVLGAGASLFSTWTTANAATQTGTIEGFVYVNALQSAPANVWLNPSIISKGATYLTLAVSNTGNLVFYHFDGTARTITSSATVPLNTWTYVAVVLSGGTATLYIGGTAVGSGTWYGIQTAGLSTNVTLGQTTAGQFFNGFISNLRVSTSARSVSAPSAPYASDANTSLLTCQSNRFIDSTAPNVPKSGGLAITVTGTPKVTNFSPFAPASAYTPATYGGSGYFDGAGDYLTLTGQNLNVGPWTIECWVMFSSFSTNTSPHIFNFGASASNRFVVWRNNATGKLSFATINSGTANVTDGTTSPVVNAWYYVAAVNSSGSTKLYVNGVLEATNTSSIPAGSSWAIGTTQFSPLAADYLAGNVADFRVSSTARTITVPTAPLTTDANTSLLLNFTNAGIYDNTMLNDLETRGSAQISTVGPKFGTGSMVFDGSTAYLYLPGNAQSYAFGTGDFTVEFWLYLTSYGSGNQNIIEARNSATDTVNWAIYLENLSGVGTKQVRFFAANADRAATANNFPTGSWQFIELVRTSGVTKFYLNGSQVGSNYTDTNNYSTTQLYIGAYPYPSATAFLNGKIDELRVTKGIARTITVPTGPFPNQ